MAVSYSYLATDTTERRSWLQETAVVVGASFIIALFAPVSFHLPFTPVPFATQAPVVLILSALLGSKRGAAAVLAYLGQGAVGLPVFAGAKGGLLYLAGPTGGYLLGYVAAAFITGWMMERMSCRTVGKAFLAMAVGNLTIFFFGMAWLLKFVGMQAAFTLGMLPFIVGDLLKLVISVNVLKRLRFFTN